MKVLMDRAVTRTGEAEQTVAGDVALSTGDLTLTTGDAIVTAGDATVTAGNVTATAGDLIATAGDVTATAAEIFGPKFKATIEGGLAILLTNKTGANSVKGTIVVADTTTDDAFKVAAVDDTAILGIVYDDGIADASSVWVVVSGIAQVLLEDTTASTRGYWVETGATTAGRADATTASPPGAVASHFQQIGHCIQSQGSGTDVLARCVLSFN